MRAFAWRASIIAPQSICPRSFKMTAAAPGFLEHGAQPHGA
jgi:hypothetical protein